MELKDLYSQIKNPIDDINNIKKLISAYSNDDFYIGLIRSEPKVYQQGEYYPKDKDYFYAMLFNLWKKSIVSITNDEFLELYKKGAYGKDFIKLREYLKNVPYVTTHKEVQLFFKKSTGNAELDKAIKKYRWIDDPYFDYIDSIDFTAKKVPCQKSEHRLYLNCESCYVYKMATYFIKKCMQHNIAYDFKFDSELNNRDDIIVIYTSTANLMKYIEILQEIKKEHPEFIAKFNNPPVLTGKIDGWIGYGSSPGRTPDGKKQSFHDLRSKIIENIIDKNTKDWILKYQNKQIRIAEKKLSLIDYISEAVAKNFLNFLANNNNYDLQNKQFRDKIYQIIKRELPSRLNAICHSSDYTNIPAIEIKLKNNQKESISIANLSKVIHEIASKIAEADPKYVEKIQQEIKNSAHKYGIDPNKYCFDTAAISKIQYYSQKMFNQSNNQTTRQTPQPPKSKNNLETLQFEQQDSLKRLKALNKKLASMQKNQHLNDMLNNYSSAKDNSTQETTGISY